MNFDQQLINAAYDGNLEAVQDALSKGANVHVNNDATLRWASTKGHLDVVKCLLAVGGDPCADDNYALQWASYYGHLGVVQCLIDHGAIGDEFIKSWWLTNALQSTNLEWLALYLNTLGPEARTQTTAIEILKANAICGAYALCWAKGQI